MTIPVALSPEERNLLFEEPVADALEREALGTVVGGGTLDGVSSDIEIELLDHKRGVHAIRTVLKRQKAPDGTRIVAVAREQIPDAPPAPNGGPAMVPCPSCGLEIPMDTNFCFGCNTSFPDGPMSQSGRRKPAARKPAAKKPAARKPAAKKPAAKKPAAKKR